MSFSPTQGAAADATGGTCALLEVFFLQPLAVQQSTLFVECVLIDASFQILSGTQHVSKRVVHSSGAIGTQSCQQMLVDASVRRQACQNIMQTRKLYDAFNSVGLQYGPGYRTLVQIWCGTNNTAAGLLRSRGAHAHASTLVHPADLDDALCLSALFDVSGGYEARLPFSVDSALLQAAPGNLLAAGFVSSRTTRTA